MFASFKLRKFYFCLFCWCSFELTSCLLGYFDNCACKYTVNIHYNTEKIKFFHFQLLPPPSLKNKKSANLNQISTFNVCLKCWNCCSIFFSFFLTCWCILSSMLFLMHFLLTYMLSCNGNVHVFFLLTFSIRNHCLYIRLLCFAFCRSAVWWKDLNWDK